MCKKDYIKEIERLIIEASKATGKKLTKNDFYISHQEKSHIPLRLPKGKMAVYTFIYNGEFLKIGQANKNSSARYQSHHYYVRSGKSTLANSLLNDVNMSSIVTSSNVTQWIKDNCERYDVIINEEHGKETLNFIEGLLQYKYKPRYEFK